MADLRHLKETGWALMRFEAIRRMWERLRASGGKAEVLDTDSFTESERAVGRLVLPALTDLTDARQTIADLSGQAHALAVALDFLPVGAIVVADDGTFVTSNAQARQLFGGVALPATTLAAARRAMQSGEPVSVALGDSRSGRLVVAEVESEPQPGGAHVLFVITDQQPANSVDARVLVNRLHLTPMQARVVSLVSLGLSNREVAERLSIATETVRKHLASSYAKTGVNNRAAIVALAYDARFGGTSPPAVH
jgi:DNA-binding CsgD family transcriptional regulator